MAKTFQARAERQNSQGASDPRVLGSGLSLRFCLDVVSLGILWATLTGLTRRVAALALCVALFGATAGRAGPDLELHVKLEELSRLLQQDSAAHLQTLPALLQRVGLSGLTDVLPAGEAPGSAPQAAPPRPAQRAQAGVENFRVALALLTQIQGGQDNFDVLLAHGDATPRALGFRGGEVRLEDIRRALQTHAPDKAMTPFAPALRLPLILWQDTVLRLSPGDRLELSRSDGAFIISFGRVEIDGAEILAHGHAHEVSGDFRPFVTIAGGGSLAMRRATIRGLGFGKTAKFSGLSVLAQPLMPVTGATEIRDSHFEDVTTLSLASLQGPLVTGNRFYDMRRSALSLTGTRGADIAGNLFFGQGPTNAVRLLKGSDHVRVRGNILLEGDRAGILVQGQSNGARIIGNVIWNRSGGAIKLAGVACGVVRDNLLINSRQKGIDLRGNRFTTVEGNRISGSKSAGIWVSAQDRSAVTYVTGNVLRGNSAGLATATGAQLWLAGNDFSQQMPRLVDGDIMLQNRAIVRDLRGAAPLLLTAAEARQGVGKPRSDCAQELVQ